MFYNNVAVLEYPKPVNSMHNFAQYIVSRHSLTKYIKKGEDTQLLLTILQGWMFYIFN